MNAKHEMLNLILETAPIKCAVIKYKGLTIRLKQNHSEENLDKFFDELDFVYDKGYGSQQLFGTVWFQDGTWATRGEYDGSEWWDHHTEPEIPEDL